MHRSGAAERDEREVTRVDAALHGDDADRGGHVRVHDVVDGARRVGDVDAERVGDATRQIASRRGVGREHHATGEAAGIEVAEQEVGVGDGRIGAAAPVARRARQRRPPTAGRRAARRRRRSTRCSRRRRRPRRGRRSVIFTGNPVPARVPPKLPLPPTWKSLASRGRPSRTMPTLAVVPPMSNEITSRRR